MIQRHFTAIASIYDRMNRLLSLGLDRCWRQKALLLIPPCRPSHIIDLATGTGDLAFLLAERFTEANVLGIDFTPTMLKIAQSRNTCPRVLFAEADAQSFRASLACKDASVDLVTCAFGFRNFPNRATALSECAHVLRLDGKLLVLEFFRPKYRILGALTGLWIRMLAWLFAPDCQSAYTHLRESMQGTCSEDAFIQEAKTRGLKFIDRRFFPPACTALLFSREMGRQAEPLAEPHNPS